MSYFHIQRINGIRKEWNKGDFGKTSDNNFFNDILEGIDRNSKLQFNEKSLIQKSREILYKKWADSLDLNSKDYKSLFYKAESLALNYKKLASNLLRSHSQNLKWIQEEIFEHNRKQINTELPSRKKCIWLCNKSELEYWWGIFSNSKNKKIIELELDKKGKLHIADARFIDLNTYSSINELNKASIKYWNGNINTELKIEILFEGKFKVINEYKNLDDIQTCT